MSGHSHWSSIKRQKQTQDQKRGRVFGKIAREIQIAARNGSDPEFNSKLRMVLERAKKLNMPQENINRAIEKGAKGGESVGLEELVLEGYGAGGVAIMLKAVTDNKNRTVADVRHIFRKHEGSLGEQGSAAYVFQSDPAKPTFTVPVENEKEAQKILNLIDELDEQTDVVGVWSNLG